MKDVARYLISTADEETWTFDRPVVFLGEWCRLHARKEVWRELDAVVAPPYGLGVERKDRDYAEARALEAKLFPEFFAVLDEHHGTQHGERFWRTVMGHWFRRAIDVLLNRVRTVEQCLALFAVSGTTLSCEGYSLAPVDSYDAVLAFNDDRWNAALFSKILTDNNALMASAEVRRTSPGEMFFRRKVAQGRGSFKRRLLNVAYHHASKLARRFVRDSDVFIVRSYLPMSTVARLELALGQCPQIWNSPRAEITAERDLVLRNKLAVKLMGAGENYLENFSRRVLFEMLPVSFLEGFPEIVEVGSSLPWPASPRLIWTSNAFDTDDVFKVWAASKFHSSRYIVGQHGNNYGTHRYIRSTVEESTADTFLTWGWTDGSPQHTPAFIFKTAGRKPRKFNARGGLLLIESCLNHRITTWDGMSEFAAYFLEQKEFVARLSAEQRKSLTIRLPAAYRDLTWDDLARWREFDPEVKIETGEAAIDDLIADSRLVVHSYDSTGVLEALSQDIPNIAFWQNGLDHLRDSVKPHYQQLVDVGIFHLSVQSAVKRVDEVWNDVEGWWRQKRVQEARQRFCARYARHSESPVGDLRVLLAER